MKPKLEGTRELKKKQKISSVKQDEWEKKFQTKNN